MKYKIYYTLPKFSVVIIMTEECHVDESSKGRYDIILVRYILPPLELNIKFLNTSLKQVIDI